MAQARVTLVCEECGETFTKTSRRQNRTDADNWEEWAKEHITMCPTCYGKAVYEELKQEMESKYILPKITGKSEKQIAYAEKLRLTFLKQNYNFAASVLKKTARFANLSAEDNGKRRII